MMQNKAIANEGPNVVNVSSIIQTEKKSVPHLEVDQGYLSNLEALSQKVLGNQIELICEVQRSGIVSELQPIALKIVSTQEPITVLVAFGVGYPQ
jgi:hypothetical protein